MMKKFRRDRKRVRDLEVEEIDKNSCLKWRLERNEELQESFVRDVRSQRKLVECGKIGIKNIAKKTYDAFDYSRKHMTLDGKNHQMV